MQTNDKQMVTAHSYPKWCLYGSKAKSTWKDTSVCVPTLCQSPPDSAPNHTLEPSAGKEIHV